MSRIEKESRHDVNALRVERELRGIDNFIYGFLGKPEQLTDLPD
jgi:hypothetical protein